MASDRISSASLYCGRFDGIFLKKFSMSILIRSLFDLTTKYYRNSHQKKSTFTSLQGVWAWVITVLVILAHESLSRYFFRFTLRNLLVYINEASLQRWFNHWMHKRRQKITFLINVCSFVEHKIKRKHKYGKLLRLTLF